MANPVTSSGLGFLPGRCPHCRSIESRRVGPENALDRLTSWLLQSYRCALCGRQFHLFRWQSPVMDAT